MVVGCYLLLKTNIEFQQKFEVNNFNCEALCIEVNYNNKPLHIITVYNPPNATINDYLFEFIDNQYQYYIIGGDFNAKNTSFGCKNSNMSGLVLMEFINKSRAILINNKEQTYFQTHNYYSELLDLILISSNLYTELKKFNVLNNCDLGSDHFAICCELKNNKNVNNRKSNNSKENNEFNLNYAKADWAKFTNELDKIEIEDILKINDVNIINEFIITSILNAAILAIPNKQSNKVTLRLPKYLKELIQLRRYYKKIIYKNKNDVIKQKYYLVSRTIKEELALIRNKKWCNFSDEFAKQPMCSTKFWNEIKKLINNDTQKKDTFPTLKHDNNSYETDEQKANLFGKILSETFKTEHNEGEFNDVFRDQIESEVKKFKNITISNNETTKPIEIVNIEKINALFKKIKPTVSHGEDHISNKLMKNVNIKIKMVLVHLFNISISNSIVPERWKRTVVKMIPKKVKNSNDPKGLSPDFID